jgi:hypothetical protein
MFFVDFFIRGISFFSSSGFVFVAAVIWLVAYRARVAAPAIERRPASGPA